MVRRTKLLVLLLPPLVGLIVTLATLGATTDIHPTPDGYRGNARLYGAPLPYYFTLLPGGGSDQLMAAMVCSNYSGTCGLCEGRPEYGPFMLMPFLLDVAAWSAVAAVPVSIGVLTIVAARKRSD